MSDQINNNSSEPDINLIKQVTTLVSDVKYLKEGQDNFHQEMRRTFDDLKNNYSGRLDRYEARLKIIDDWKIVQIQKVADNKKYMQFLIAGMILLLGILIWHLTGYHI